MQERTDFVTTDAPRHGGKTIVSGLPHAALGHPRKPAWNDVKHDLDRWKAPGDHCQKTAYKLWFQVH